MNLDLRYSKDRQEAEFSWSEAGPWTQLASILLAVTSSSTLSTNSIKVPWYAVLGAWDQLGEFFALNPSVSLVTDQSATTELEHALQRRQLARKTLESGISAKWHASQVLKRLENAGFRRDLKLFQIKNLQTLCATTAAASFSVPGAGKTTEAIAYFAATSEPEDRLLVLAPKNAFSAWQEAIDACLPNAKNSLVRLVGGESQISRLLLESPRFMIMAYSQLARDPLPDLVSKLLTEGNFYLFLDESHRIKHGTSGKAGQAALRLSSLPRRKLILSGTPMPQGYEDLIPQFSFLFPEVSFPASEEIIKIIRPTFVRTTKSELGLPSANPPRIYDVPMSEAQSRLNTLLHDDLRRYSHIFNRSQKIQIRKLRRKVLRLIQLNANPSIVASWEDDELDVEILRALMSEPAAKLDAACELVRYLADSGEKVLIWTNFRASMQALRVRLADLNPEYIDGSVDAGDSEDPRTREGRLRRFSEDSTCKVLVANPMAAAEGISLHMVCRHAVYLDRTFNAAQYLQSLDRIYRVGMREDWHPTWHILVHRGTIDEVVDTRLRLKIERMAAVLNDPDLRAMGGEWFELHDDAEITEDIVLGATLSDLEASVTGNH